jgi:hypothetical protein
MKPVIAKMGENHSLLYSLVYLLIFDMDCIEHFVQSIRVDKQFSYRVVGIYITHALGGS